jgi:hypothetical protein
LKFEISVLGFGFRGYAATMSGKALPFRSAPSYSRRNRSGDFDAAHMGTYGEPKAHRSSGGEAARLRRGVYNVALGDSRMPKYEPKTRETDARVEDFLNSLENKERREDGFRVLEMFTRLTGEKAKMWGPAIIGFSKAKIKYADGSDLDWPAVAFSPRKQNLTLYVITGTDKQKKLFEKLGKHSTSVSCLYIKRLPDVDTKVLEKVIADAYKHVVKV